MKIKIILIIIIFIVLSIPLYLYVEMKSSDKELKDLGMESNGYASYNMTTTDENNDIERRLYINRDSLIKPHSYTISLHSGTEEPFSTFYKVKRGKIYDQMVDLQNGVGLTCYVNSDFTELNTESKFYNFQCDEIQQELTEKSQLLGEAKEWTKNFLNLR